MSRLTFNPTSLAKLHLPVLPILKGYEGEAYYRDHNLPHPLALVTSSWQHLQQNVEVFFHSYNQYASAERTYSSINRPYVPKNPSDPSLLNVVKDYRGVIYSATELAENLTDNLKYCLLPEGLISQWRPEILKRWVNHPKIVCNKLKHEHNLIIPVEGDYHMGTVKGYAICRYEGDAIKPNPQIHTKRSPFAFGMDLRRIFANLYLISESVATEIQRLIPGSPEVALDTDKAQIALVTKISRFMPLTFHHYIKTDEIATFNFFSEDLVIDDLGGTIIPPGKGKLRTTYSGDGFTRAFHLF